MMRWINAIFSGVKSALLWIFSQPLLAAFVTILGVIAGLLGSLYTPEIKSSQPIVFFQKIAPNVSEAGLFWLSLLLFALFFFGMQWARDYQTKKAQTGLIAKSSDLELLVKTLPPQGFLTQFSETYQISHRAAQNILSDTSPKLEDIETAIRFILRDIVFLARQFDGHPDGVRYASNVMVYYAKTGLDADKEGVLKELLRFFDRDTSKLAGYLQLIPELSTATDSQGPKELPKPDPYLEIFTLPIENQDISDQGRWRQLPGGSLALRQNTPLHYDDTQTLGDWCRQYCDFAESIAQQVDDYFLSEKALRIRSFASIPVPATQANLTPCAVLNIHRSQPNILKGEQAFKLFFPLVKPYTMLISDLLNVRAGVLKS